MKITQKDLEWARNAELVYVDDEVNKADKEKYALYIGLNVTGAEHLAIDGGEDPKDFHVTLAYGYYHPQSDVEDTATRIQSAREKAVKYLPDTLKLDAIGRFEASDSSDGKDVIYARVAPGQLEKAHNILLKELKNNGLPIQDTFDEYNPHMTLAYIDPDEEVELKEIDETVTIKNLTEGFETDEASSKENQSTFNIAKTDDDKRLVFGWALVAKDKDGNVIRDHQNDIVDEDDLEEGAYEYVLNFRDSGEEHLPGLRKKARMVESCVFTEEKQKALGIPQGIVPTGWWIGFYVDDDEAWNKIKNGTYKMFSIEGKAIRVPVDEVQHTDDLTKSDNVAKTFAEILKFNPYHGKDGRFASANNYSSFTYAPGKSKAHDLAIAREKERAAAGAAAGANDEASKKRIAESETKLKSMLKDGAEVKLSGVDPELAESTVSSVQKVLEKYPSVKNAFNGFTTDEPEKGYFTDKQGTYACYSPNTGKIHLNLNNYSNKADFEKRYNEALKEKHFPEGTTAKSAVVHEMGHAIDRYVSLQTIDTWKVNWGGETVSSRIWNTDIRAAKKKGEPMTGKSIKEGLSRYASKNAHEYFAEAFSESMTSPNPRKMASSIVKRMETYIKKAEKSVADYGEVKV